MSKHTWLKTWSAGMGVMGLVWLATVGAQAQGFGFTYHDKNWGIGIQTGPPPVYVAPPVYVGPPGYVAPPRCYPQPPVVQYPPVYYSYPPWYGHPRHHSRHHR